MKPQRTYEVSIDLKEKYSRNVGIRNMSDEKLNQLCQEVEVKGNCHWSTQDQSDIVNYYLQ